MDEFICLGYQKYQKTIQVPVATFCGKVLASSLPILYFVICKPASPSQVPLIPAGAIVIVNDNYSSTVHTANTLLGDLMVLITQGSVMRVLASTPGRNRTVPVTDSIYN